MLQISNLVVIPERDDFAHQLYYQDSDFQVVDRVVELAQQRSVALTQIASCCTRTSLKWMDAANL